MRHSNMLVTGIDSSAVFEMAKACGYDLAALAEFLPVCEKAMVLAMNEEISSSLQSS